MHLLFISSNRIGDSLINLQVLNRYIRKNKKDIEITLVSGSLPLPIYDDYPNIVRRIILKKENNFIEIYCTNDQVNIFNFFQKYAKLSDVLLEEKKTFINNINEQYFIDLLSQGYIDSNILPHSRFNPSEISPSYIDYEKGCYVGQEVVSRMKHRQLNKKRK